MTALLHFAVKYIANLRSVLGHKVDELLKPSEVSLAPPSLLLEVAQKAAEKATSPAKIAKERPLG